MTRLRGIDPYQRIMQIGALDCIDGGILGDGPLRLRAIHGSPTAEASFKSILGLGLLIIAREENMLAPGQPVIESTSGSLGLGLAVAGQIMGHEVHLVTDRNIPPATRMKAELVGAHMHIVQEPHPALGFQQSRDDLLKAIIAEHPEYYWTNQNDSPLNPLVYERWVVSHIETILDFSKIAAGIFCVGSGGHFSALSAMLSAKGIPSYVADRRGSITFGGAPGPSILRGSGNQNCVPKVIQRAKPRVRGVYYVTDTEAARGVRDLAARGISAGGSSGVCFAGAENLAEDLLSQATTTSSVTGEILTFLPDRGELYGTTFLDWKGHDD